MAGADLVAAHPKDWAKRLSKLRDIDWSRGNRAQWDGRALVAGKVNKSKNNVILVANVVRRALGLSLPEEATRIETLYGAGPDKRLKKAG